MALARGAHAQDGGKCRRGNVFCRAAGERGPVSRRDEGPGETEGVSPGAISRPVETQSGPGRIRGQNEEV